MAQIDWQSIMNGQMKPKRRYQGANVKFFNAYNENKEKSVKEGRPIYDEIPSISIQWPGQDETVRRIEPQDIQEYPEKYAAFMAGNEPIDSGLPLTQWPPIPGTAVRELQHMGFKTVEQLAEANDDVKRRIGPLSKYVKTAQEWLKAANSSQSEVVKLKEMLDREQNRTARLEHQVELLMQRVEANEGTNLRSVKKEVIQESQVEDDLDIDPIEDAPKRRGRPKKV